MPDPIRVLVADDHPLFREGVTYSLRGDPGLKVVAQVGSGEEAVETALAGALLAELSSPPTPDPVSDLTARQTKLLNLIGQGLTIREIGAQIHLAEETVKHYVTLLLEKLQVRNRTEAALVAVRHDGSGFQCAGERPHHHRAPIKR